MKDRLSRRSKRALIGVGIFLCILVFEYLTVSNVGVVGPPLARSRGAAYSLVPLRGLLLRLVTAASVVTMQPMRAVMIASHLHDGMCRDIMKTVYLFRNSQWRYATQADDLAVASVNAIVWFAVLLCAYVLVRKVAAARKHRATGETDKRQLPSPT